jgi:putative hydrolase of the HAD superfamily
LLIIFDLDDTLVDTSGSITPIKLQMALERMVDAGLLLQNQEDALDLLRRLDTSAESAREALSEFLEILGADEKFFTIGLQEIYGDLPLDIAVFPLNEVLEILAELKESHQLALVSVGKCEQQLLKMKKAGIDSTIFSKIVISEDRNKKPHYQAVVEELGFTPDETIVCGDKIGIDLSPAKELGCKTVHMRSGRGKNSLSPSKGDVDFTINELKQIKEIIATL